MKKGKSLESMELDVSLDSTFLALGPIRQRDVYSEVTSSRKTLRVKGI